MESTLAENAGLDGLDPGPLFCLGQGVLGCPQHTSLVDVHIYHVHQVSRILHPNEFIQASLYVCKDNVTHIIQ